MRVSLCTVCKNRASHYKRTIIKNIEGNIHDENVEFILLDYNSDDDLENWVKQNLTGYIKSGLLTYYKTLTPKYFLRSHSRNMAFKLAKGDILCNIDADNYTGPNFSTYIVNQFAKSENIFICAGGQFDSISCADVVGRICIHNKDFRISGGYDESMHNYGMEDFDLINRLEMMNLQKRMITDDIFLKVIRHGTKERIAEEFPFKNIENIYIHYISPAISKVLLLFSNDTCAFATLFNERSRNASNRSLRFIQNNKSTISIAEGFWTLTNVQTNDNGKFDLVSLEGEVIYNGEYKDDEERICLSNSIDSFDFFPLKNEALSESTIQFYSESHNRIKMDNNFLKKIINPNKAQVGRGIVYKNFDYTNPIIV